MIKYACLVAVVLIVPAAHAATYRWVDDEGVINFAAQQPRGVPPERITVIGDERDRRGRRVLSRAPSPPPAAAPAAAPATAAARQMPAQQDLSEEQQAMLRRLQEAEQARQMEVARIRQDNCDRSRRVLTNLSGRTRIRVNNPDGTQRAMPEEERLAKIEEAQRGIVANCDS